jgi:hypothetical protein
LLLGYWSFTLMIIPVGTIFMQSLHASAANRASKRTAPPRVSVPDLLSDRAAEHVQSR